MKTPLVFGALAGLAALVGTSPCGAQTRSPPVTVIIGTLLGSDGAPMKLAHVHLLRGLPTLRRALRPVPSP